MKHLEAFIFLMCFLFTTVLSNVNGYIMDYGVLGCTVTLLTKTFVVMYFPFWILRAVISKVRSWKNAV